MKQTSRKFSWIRAGVKRPVIGKDVYPKTRDFSVLCGGDFGRHVVRSGVAGKIE
jgi:hypothetical protein